MAIAVYASGTNEIVLTDNLVLDVTGGYGDASPKQGVHSGFRISQAITATVNANKVNHITGGDGEAYCYVYGYGGGSAVGLSLDGVSHTCCGQQHNSSSKRRKRKQLTITPIPVEMPHRCTLPADVPRSSIMSSIAPPRGQARQEGRTVQA